MALFRIVLRRSADFCLVLSYTSKSLEGFPIVPEGHLLDYRLRATGIQSPRTF